MFRNIIKLPIRKLSQNNYPFHAKFSTSKKHGYFDICQDLNKELIELKNKKSNSKYWLGGFFMILLIGFTGPVCPPDEPMCPARPSHSISYKKLTNDSKKR